MSDPNNWAQLSQYNSHFMNSNGFGNSVSDNIPNTLKANSIWDMNPTQVNQNFGMGSGIPVNDFKATPSLFDIGNGTPTQGNDFWSLSNPDMWQSGAAAIGAIGAIGNTYLGFQQLGQAQDQLAFQKEAFWTNYNQQMEDRKLAAERRNIASGRNQPTE